MMKQNNTNQTPEQEGDTAVQDATVSDKPNSNADYELLKAEHEALIDQLRRLQAEFDNYRKRVEREEQEQQAAANDKLLYELLPIIDNFSLALLHAKDSTGAVNSEELIAGVIMINEQLKQLLEHAGLQEVPVTGVFDPKMHEAVTTISQEGVARGIILQVYQQGFTRGGKLFRPARVCVAR